MEHKNIEKKENIRESQGEHEEGKKAITLNQEEYNQLKAEADKSREYWDKILRLQADFENTRKRLEREKQDFVRFANENLIINLLNVIDDLERTLELAQAKHEDFSAFLKGVEMILAHLYDLLKKQGLSSIEAKGKQFDPNFHEALLKIDTDEFTEDTVVEELQKGYTLNGRVVRTAKVKVAKGPPPEADSPAAKEDKKQKEEDKIEKQE